MSKPIRWGGTLIETRHLKEHTELELTAHPLDSCGRPRTGAGQTGRFIIIHPGFLDTTDYPIGRPVSATGRITGIRKGGWGTRITASRSWRATRSTCGRTNRPAVTIRAPG